MLELALVACLFASDAEPPKEWVEVLAPSILTVAVSAELLNERDARQYRVAGVHGLYRECATLPHLDCWPSPPLPVLIEAMKVNREYRCLLCARRELDCFHEELLDGAIAELDWTHYVYGLAATIADPGWAMQHRRQAIVELGAAIGEEAVARGRLPVPVR